MAHNLNYEKSNSLLVGSSLASILVGGSNITKGTGMIQWEKAISKPKEKIYQWHKMLETNNKLSCSMSMLSVK